MSLAKVGLTSVVDPIIASHRRLLMRWRFEAVCPLSEYVVNPKDCELLWRQMHERQTLAASAEPYREFPELEQRAIEDARQFADRSPPASAHELNVRRVEASAMLASWGAELTRLTIGCGRTRP